MDGRDFLLDTCALLYLMAGSPEVPGGLEKMLAETSGAIFYSQVNLIEIQIKYRIGKLKLAEEPGILMPREIARHRFERLDLTDSSVFAMQEIPLIHRDPFDRLLIGQALTHGCTLVTPDERIHRYPVETLWQVS